MRLNGWRSQRSSGFTWRDGDYRPPPDRGRGDGDRQASRRGGPCQGTGLARAMSGPEPGSGHALIPRSRSRSRSNPSLSLGGMATGLILFQQQDRVAPVQLLADGDLDLLDPPARRGRNVHGRLVALQGEQGLLRLHPVTRGHQDLDDLDIGEIANVRQGHFLHCCHVDCSPGREDVRIRCGVCQGPIRLLPDGVRPSPDWACPDRCGTARSPPAPGWRGSRPRPPRP